MTKTDLLFIVGACLAIAGVGIEAGVAWALIAAGVLLAGFAVALVRGGES